MAEKQDRWKDHLEGGVKGEPNAIGERFVELSDQNHPESVEEQGYHPHRQES